MLLVLMSEEIGSQSELLAAVRVAAEVGRLRDHAGLVVVVALGTLTLRDASVLLGLVGEQIRLQAERFSAVGVTADVHRLGDDVRV